MPGPAAALPLLAAAGRNLPAIGSVVKGLSRSVPRLEDEVTVEVVGQPGSTKRQLYYLALSTACGIVRRYDIFSSRGVFSPPPPGMLMVEYDAADNWVRVTLRYNTSLLNAAIASKPSTLLGVLGGVIGTAVQAYLATSDKPLPLYSELALFSGPREEVVGREFNFTGGALAPGIPTSSSSAGAPQLPFAGRTILTTSPVVQDPVPGPGLPVGRTVPAANPKPPGDNRSRGAVVHQVSRNDPNAGLDIPSSLVTTKLVPLVFAALSDPGGNDREYFRTPRPGPNGS